MRFLAANCEVPVPKVHAAFRDPGTNKTYIIMQYLPGDTIQELLPSIEPVEKTTVCKLIKGAIIELRSIPPPGYFGMLNRQPYRQPYLDGVFWTEGLNPKISGPFRSQEDMNLAIIEKLRQTESDQYTQLLRNMINQTLNSHRTVFTHGDLQPKNIMVQRLGDRDGCPGLGSLYWTGKALDGIRSSGISATLQSPVGSNPTSLDLCLRYWTSTR